MGAVAAGVLAYLVLLVVALAGGPVSPTSLLPIPEAAVPTIVTTDVPASSPEATSLPRNETTTTPPSTTSTTTVSSVTTATSTSENGNKRTDPPGASNRPSAPGQGKP